MSQLVLGFVSAYLGLPDSSKIHVEARFIVRDQFRTKTKALEQLRIGRARPEFEVKLFNVRPPITTLSIVDDHLASLTAVSWEPRGQRNLIWRGPVYAYRPSDYLDRRFLYQEALRLLRLIIGASFNCHPREIGVDVIEFDFQPTLKSRT